MTPSAEVATTMRTAQMLIGGEWTGAGDGRTFPIETPAKRGAVIGHAARGTAADVDRAVRAASAAFAQWQRTAARERGQLLVRIADRIDARREELAQVIAMETGNAIRTQARPEVLGAADVFRYFGGLAGELKGETIPLGERMFSYTRREPYGVVGAIVPWNAPVGLAAVKIAPALAAGNTMVLKPSAEAPLAVLLLARICSELLPAGVLNVVTGFGDEAGMALAMHPLVRKLTFTGHTETGKLVMRAAAERIVPLSLELGGKSPSIVFPDANDETVVDGVIASMRFTRQGQSCTAGSRLFIHRSIADSFLEKLARKLSALRIGDPLDEATDIGALINQGQFEKVCNYIREGISQAGADTVLGGLPPTSGPLSEGYFVPPTVIANVGSDWRVAREEIFGPVLVAISWSDEGEAIRMANDTHYGLAAYVWTRDMSTAIRTAHALEAGWVQVNQGLGQFPGQSYGGYKQSGFGREYSLEGMLESYTQRKSVTINIAGEVKA